MGDEGIAPEGTPQAGLLHPTTVVLVPRERPRRFPQQGMKCPVPSVSHRLPPVVAGALWPHGGCRPSTGSVFALPASLCAARASFGPKQACLQVVGLGRDAKEQERRLGRMKQKRLSRGDMRGHHRRGAGSWIPLPGNPPSLACHLGSSVVPRAHGGRVSPASGSSLERWVLASAAAGKAGGSQALVPGPRLHVMLTIA